MYLSEAAQMPVNAIERNDKTKKQWSVMKYLTRNLSAYMEKMRHYKMQPSTPDIEKPKDLTPKTEIETPEPPSLDPIKKQWFLKRWWHNLFGVV